MAQTCDPQDAIENDDTPHRVVGWGQLVAITFATAIVASILISMLAALMYG